MLMRNIILSSFILIELHCIVLTGGFIGKKVSDDKESGAYYGKLIGLTGDLAIAVSFGGVGGAFYGLFSFFY